MKLSFAQTDEKTLAQFGAEACELMKSRNFARLAERFGYSLAFGRDIAEAIEQDLQDCLAEANKGSNQIPSSIQVKYFSSNSTHLFALVECITPITEYISVLIELIVCGDGEEKYISLEQISVA